MKRILFLSFAYPFGHYGPSDNCTVRIMEALALNGTNEIWNISYKPQNNNSQPNYKVVKGVNLLFLPFSENKTHHSFAIEHLLLLLKVPFYPLFSLRSLLKHYKACRALLDGRHFDLVVSQCAPQDSVISGTLLKRSGLISKHMVLFWDNIYGKMPRMLIPKWFARYRSRIVENWIARYSEKLVSPIPVKSFHDQFGDVKAAVGKRVYLGHPLINRPCTSGIPVKPGFVKTDKINIIYAGRLYCVDDIQYAIELLNSIPFAERINLVLFFYQMPSENERSRMRHGFKGTIVFSGRIPIDDLLCLYSQADVFLGFAGGNYSQVISKIYDYMCFGKPVVYFYKDDNDVNLREFAKYPLFTSIDIRLSLSKNNSIKDFLALNLGRQVPFERVESLFPTATATAYVDQILLLVDGN